LRYTPGTPEYFAALRRKRRNGWVLFLIGWPLLAAYGLGLILILIGLVMLAQTKQVGFAATKQAKLNQERYDTGREARRKEIQEEEQWRQSVRRDNSVPQPAPVYETRTVVERVLIQCSHCGNRYPQGTLKCTNCGARL